MVSEVETEKVALRANPSFTCAGVNWGVEQLKQLLKIHGTVYIPNKDGLVHNKRVTEELRAQGAVFVNDSREVPIDSVVANSMHGLSPLDTQVFIQRRVLHYDLSCHLVDQVHQRILRAIKEAEQRSHIAKIIYYCKTLTHPEPKAVIELAPSHVVPITGRQDLEEYQVKPDEMYFADSQTTLNVQQGMTLIEEYRNKFKGLRSLPRMGVCFATYNRQQALQALIKAGIDKLVVLGDPESSNTTELVKIGRENNLPVEFLGRARLMKAGMFDGFPKVGVHGGASVLPDEGDIAMELLRGWGYKTTEVVVGKMEPRTFPNIKPPVYDYRSGHLPQEILSLTRVY